VGIELGRASRFEIFQRLHSRAVYSAIGLSVCKNAAERASGDTLGRVGTRTRFYVPIHAPEVEERRHVIDNSQLPR
jgi:hypothetical protein